MRTYRSTRTLKRLAMLAVFLLDSGFISPISAIQPSRAVLAAPQVALAPNYAWHTFYGSDVNDSLGGVASDAFGNIYLVGTSNATWQGPEGQSPLHAFGSLSDILVVKLTPNGDYVWHTFYGEGGYDSGSDIAIDDSGNLYIVGTSNYSWHGDHWTSPIHAYWGGDDLTVLKLDSNGEYLWHTFYGGGGEVYCNDSGGGIALDGQGYVYITGSSQSPWRGDGSILPLHAHSGGGEYERDIVTLKLSKDGAYRWHTFYGSSGDDRGDDLAADDQGNLVVIGESDGSWQGDQDASPLHAYQDDYDMAVLKLSATGAYLWHTFYGSSFEDGLNGIAFDVGGNILVSGSSWVSWNGDGGILPLHSHSANADQAILKLTEGGGYQWHTFYGSSEGDYSNDLAVDRQDNLILTGSSDESWLGDGNAPPIHAYNALQDITILKLDNDGHYVWHTFYGSGDYEWGDGLAVDPIGNLVIAADGYSSWQGDGDADPLNSYTGEYDITVFKLAGGQYYLPLLQR